MGALGLGDGPLLNRFGRGRQPRRHRHGDLALLDGLDEFGRGVIDALPRRVARSACDTFSIERAAFEHDAILHLVAVPVARRASGSPAWPRPCRAAIHRVPAVEVQRQHERQRVVAVEFEELAARFRRPRTPGSDSGRRESCLRKS